MNKLIVIIGAGSGLGLSVAKRFTQEEFDCVNRDKCEYAYQCPSLSPEKLYQGQIPAYGLFEENAGKYWGEVYQLMSSDK